MAVAPLLSDPFLQPVSSRFITDRGQQSLANLLITATSAQDGTQVNFFVIEQA